MSELRRSDGALGELQKSGAAAIMVSGFRPRPGPRIIIDDSENAPVVFVRSDRVSALLKSGEPVKVTAHIAAPKQKAVVLRNVAGILHGSDPILKDTYILVTAHYDHLGTKPDGQGDRIYNGANDNASGTASIIEIASALSRLPAKPKRSIVFVAFFGEEEGLLGSKWYDRHPAVPLAKTIGNINLEQMGRTDDRSGKQVNTATLTGFDFSDLPQAFAKAGELTGITVYKDE
jgi:Zn-dependent M28 family amino/carboxypeptidase